ncbi:MAG TPA: hypothetical protein VHW94_13570 [Candidatus Dormibacteraeota bacterium]|nr:hypothetical protein [Candidatus Dormibacteraeota bacterium]
MPTHVAGNRGFFVVIATLACFGLATCSTAPSTATRIPTTPTPQSLGAEGCHPASPSGDFAAEIYGTAVNGTVWAWFMRSYPPKAGMEDKTLWRLAGPNTRGTPTFALLGPDGQLGRLTGLQEHGGSTWNRPGVEYGSVLLFPAAGCWDVHVTLAQLQGDVYVVVTSPT